MKKTKILKIYMVVTDVCGLRCSDIFSLKSVGVIARVLFEKGDVWGESEVCVVLVMVDKDFGRGTCNSIN